MQFPLTKLTDKKKEFCQTCGFNPDEVVLEFDPLPTNPSNQTGVLKLGGDLHEGMETKQQFKLDPEPFVYTEVVKFFHSRTLTSEIAQQSLKPMLDKKFTEEKVREKGYLEGLGLYIEGDDPKKGGTMISARKKDSKGCFKNICNVRNDELKYALEAVASSKGWDT